MASDAGWDLPPDRLSDLPDAVLISVLSLLRLDEAARCTVLASRWPRLFPSTLLDFNARMPGRRDVVEAAVSSVLAAHPAAPIRSFRTGKAFRDAWLDDLARRGVQKLSFDLDLELGCGKERIRIPDSLFACTALTRLRAGWCVFPGASATAAGAPNLACLTEVHLIDVTICDESLNALISECKALETLYMTGLGTTFAGGRIRVRSASLKVLNSDGHFKELFIEYAPNLERLYGRYMYMKPRVHLKVQHAPKLEFIGYLSMSCHAIEIGESILSKDRTDVETRMPSLKTLSIEVRYTKKGYINWITQLLKMFPCLETLYIKSDTWSVIQAAAEGSWDMLRYIPCVDNHLQKVVFEVYRGHEWQREMAKFLHGRSMHLKAMEFHVLDVEGQGEEWVREQRELLCLDSRASKDARFLFFKHMLSCSHHDLSDNEWYKGRYYDGLYKV